MSERRKILNNIDFKTFVNIFNTQGKKAAIKHVTDTYGVKYDSIVRRLRRNSEYIFDHSRDKYVLKDEPGPERPFLTVDELCNTDKSKLQHNITIDSDSIIINLIKDKFFEVSKYVFLENSRRRIILNLDAARNAGYDIEYV